MEANGESYTFDLNLDFLDSTTTNTKNSIITPVYQAQPQAHSTYDIESLANRIATVNDMTIQLKATKDENSRLHKEMQDFSESAMSIQSMYEHEKQERLNFAKLYGDLKEKYEQIESQLTNKTLHFEQIQSRLELEAGDKKPIPYNDLALRYQRLAMLLEEEKQLPTKDKLSLPQIKDYLESKKLSPLPLSKKKSHSKVKSRDFSMQCNLRVESQAQETQCSFGNCEQEPKDTCTQGTQYTWYTTTRGTNTPALTNPKTELRTQGTQYISSTTTRGTSTSTFIKTQSVGTNFPEPVPPVSIEDIFKEMIFDVSPLSPMAATPPQAEFKEEKVEMKSIGTCTGLKNVRKPIDYVAANIKNSDSRPPSRNNNSLYDRVKNEIPLMGMPTLNPFAGLGIAAAPMHNTVAELWNMLGHTIFALLQQNTGGAAAAAAASLNPMNMNLVNDRMRNISGRNRAPSEQRRNCEAQTTTDYFEQEYSREYSTTTRSAATSPILPSELLNNQQTHTRPSFVPVTRSPNPQLPVEIQKIILNKHFTTEPEVLSSRKSSKVDKILQLFPHYSDSFKIRKALKRLLKDNNKNKPPKKNRNSNSSSSWESTTTTQSQNTNVKTRPASPVSVSVLTQSPPNSPMETLQIKPDPQTTTTNWKTEIFGDSYSDSSLDSTTMEYINTHIPQETPELKLTPHEMKPPPNDLKLPITNNTNLDINRAHQVKSPIEDEFLGFDEEINLPPSSSSSNEVFCKPFSQPKREESVIRVSEPSGGSCFKTKSKLNEEPPPLPAKQPNPKRKRRTKKEIAEQANKICKLDESGTLPESAAAEISTKESKKPQKSLNLNKTKANVVLPLKSITTSASCANNNNNNNNKPLRSLSLKRIKNPKQQESKQQPPPPDPPNQTIPEPMKSPVFIKPTWMNRIQDQDPEEEQEDLSIQVSRNHNGGPMVMKVENPPDSVFQDIKTCFSNQRGDSVFQDIKTCFSTNPKRERDVQPLVGPTIAPPTNQPQKKYSDIVPEEPISFVSPKDDGTYRFLIQKQERDVKPFIGPIIPSTNQPTSQTQNNEVLVPEQQSSTPFVTAAPKENETYRFLLQNQQTTTNRRVAPPSIDSITNPSNSFKIINYYEPALQSPPPQTEDSPNENTTKSSITILNGPWISSESNDLNESKQQDTRPLSIVNPSSLDQSTFDLENMPICFLDDQNNLMPSPEPPKEEIKTFVETNQRLSYNILPGFQEIQQGIKTAAVQFIASSNSSFQQKQDQQVSKADGIQLNRFPIIVQDKPSFLQNHLATMNSIESPTTTGDVKALIPSQSSYLVLGHQKELTSYREPSTTLSKMEKASDNVLPPSNHLNVQFIGLSRSMSIPSDETDPKTQNEGQTSMFSLQNQNLFSSKPLCHTKSNEDLSKSHKEKESPVTDVQPLSNTCLVNKAFKVPELETVTNSSECLVEDKTHFKSPILSSIKKDYTDSASSSDSEGDLSIDFPPSPPSPQQVNNSALNLSAILKTPEEEEKEGEEINSPVDDEVQFKTPQSCSKNNTSLLTKVITNSTEKLVEDYIFNENPPGAKFQVFLDRILDDVAPPSSPVSALALSEKPNYSDTESSCDELSSPEATTTPIKYKRKAAPTAALAIKRSARIKAKKIETNSMGHSLCAMITTIPNVELGKYTKKKTEENLLQIVEPVLKEEKKINIQMGFFQEALEDQDDDDDGDDNEEPTCEPIRRNSVEECKPANENIPMECFRYPNDLSVKGKQQRRINTYTEDQKPSLTFPNQECDSYLSLCRTTKESISLYIKSEESPMSPKSPVPVPVIDPSLSFYDESPASPPPSDRMPIETHTTREFFEPITSSSTTNQRVNSNNKTIISHLITNYNYKHHMMLTRAQQTDGQLLDQLYDCITEFLDGLCLMMDTVRFVDAIFKLTTDDKIISKAIVSVVKVAPRPEVEITANVPDTYLSQTHRKLLAVVETLFQHFPNLHHHLQSTLEQSMFTFAKDIIPMKVLLNLTQFYLAIIAIPPMPASTNPARLFICKCLYFYNKKAVPMIYHTLCVYPTVLPQRIDSSYDRSDILISSIQSILMSTYYDPEKCDFMTRQILAKLRMFYNYESFKPPRDEVIQNMIAKIRAGRFKNVSFAFSLICKRMEQDKTEKFILNERLLPLANEFYHTLSQTSENDEKIACVLECISFVIRPFSFDTDVSQYVNLFGRFLNATSAERKVIQEAAVAAILRTARFGFVQCFNAIYNFQPTYELSETLKLMLRSFIYKKGKIFLQALERQAQELVAT